MGNVFCRLRARQGGVRESLQTKTPLDTPVSFSPFWRNPSLESLRRYFPLPSFHFYLQTLQIQFLCLQWIPGLSTS